MVDNVATTCGSTECIAAMDKVSELSNARLEVGAVLHTNATAICDCRTACGLGDDLGELKTAVGEAGAKKIMCFVGPGTA